MHRPRLHQEANLLYTVWSQLLGKSTMCTTFFSQICCSNSFFFLIICFVFGLAFLMDLLRQYTVHVCSLCTFQLLLVEVFIGTIYLIDLLCYCGDCHRRDCHCANCSYYYVAVITCHITGLACLSLGPFLPYGFPARKQKENNRKLKLV